MTQETVDTSPAHRLGAVRPRLVILTGVLCLLAGLAAAKNVPAVEGEPDTKAPSEPSKSDRLVNLQQALASDEAKLERLQQERRQKAEEFERVNGFRETLDIRIEELREQLSQLDDPEQQAAIEAEIDELSIESRLGRKHTDILVDANKTLQEQAETLQLKIEADRAAYRELSGEATPAAEAAGGPPATDPAAAATESAPTLPSPL